MLNYFIKTYENLLILEKKSIFILYKNTRGKWISILNVFLIKKILLKHINDKMTNRLHPVFRKLVD